MRCWRQSIVPKATPDARFRRWRPHHEHSDRRFVPRRFKRPYIVIHRVDLHRILLDACEKEANVELMPLTGVDYFEDTATACAAADLDDRGSKARP